MLRQLKLYNFRNINQLVIDVKSDVTIVIGENGCGKTSVLEAIYLLLSGKSFRTSQIGHLLQINQEELIVTGLLKSEKPLTNSLEDLEEDLVSIGVSKHKLGRLKLRYNNQTISTRKKLAQIAAVQIFCTETWGWLFAGSSYRREYVDWLLFYSVSNFSDMWYNYNQALQQRNKYLNSIKKSNKAWHPTPWDAILCDYGQQIIKLRSSAVSKLLPMIITKLSHLLPNCKWVNDFGINIISGYNQDLNYKESLQASWQKDVLVGYTTCGAHRFNFDVLIKNTLAKDFLSRGHNKIILCAMIMARTELLQNINKHSNNIHNIILLDDLFSELDAVNADKFLSFLTISKVQAFVSATPQVANFIDLSKFHMEHL